MNIANLLREAARSFPTRPAITHGSNQLTYAEFDQQSAAFAAWLGAVGGAPDGRVLLFLDNCPELLVTMFGTFRAGATVVPCNSRLTVDELSFIVTDCDVRVIVTDPAHVDVATMAAGVDRLVVVVGAQGSDSPPPPDEFPGRVSSLAFSDTIATAGPLEPVAVDSDHTAWIFYTSGTTGRPKGAMLPHSVLNFCTVSWLADLTPLNETDVTLHAAPLSHGAGFHALAATARAAHQIIPTGTSFDPANMCRLINEVGVTNTWLVPTQIVMLTEAAPEGLTLPSLHYVVYGGAPMTPAALVRALDKFGPIFVQLFGQGETPMTATVMRRQDHTAEFFGSAGRARPGIEVRIADADGNELPDGEVGELVVRGPSLMSGYWKRPEATSDTIRNGWLFTGDLGRRTADGIFFLLDRAKDMIISGGSNVYAVEVEDVINRHEAVGEVAVIGLPDDKWGELVVAVIVPADPAATPDAAAIDAHARVSLAGYKIPRRYLFVDSLPRNAYGKVLKRTLRESYS